MNNNPFLIKKRINQELAKIPKKNREKFTREYFALIFNAQQEDYNDKS